MANYRIRFDNGTSEVVQAAAVEYDYHESLFRFLDEKGQTVAWVPTLNVQSVTDANPQPRNG